MHVPQRIDRKLFLTWAVGSTTALALGCSAEGPSGPLGGGAGSAGSASGGAPGGSAGTSPGGTNSVAGGGAGGSGPSGGSTPGGTGGGSALAPDCNVQLKTLITANHNHVLTVTAADVTAGMPKVYDTTGTSDHPHYVQLTAADFAKLQSGGMVRKVTCNDEHEHEFIINCVGMAMPDTTSGVANHCDPDHSCGSMNAGNFCPDIP